MNAPTRPVFATCDLCDAFENDTTGSFRVLSPVFNDYGAIGKFCGPVVTLRCLEDNSRVREAVNSPGFLETPQGRVGRVLVIDGAGSLRRALPARGAGGHQGVGVGADAHGQAG